MVRVAIVTKGNREFGMGHVYRMLSLARTLTKLSKYTETAFLLTPDSSNIAFNKISSEGLPVDKVNDYSNIPRLIHDFEPDIVVFDLLRAPTRIVKKIRGENPGVRITLFDNNSKANIYADTVVNALTLKYGNRSYYDMLSETLYLFGPRYLLLRDEFYQVKRECSGTSGYGSLLVSFGGSDPNDYTAYFLNTIRRKKKLPSEINTIRVVLGPQYPGGERIAEITRKIRRETSIVVEVYRDTRDLAQLICGADLVATSPGLTMFEAWFLGKPTLLLYQNDVQKRYYRWFLVKVSERNYWTRIFKGSVYVNPSNSVIADLSIGNGRWEVIESVSNRHVSRTIHTGERLLLRQAANNDLELLMAWRSHPYVYKYFYLQKAPLKWDEHFNWWRNRRDRVDWVISLEDENGIVRRVGSANVSKLTSENPEVGIYVGEITLWGRRIGRNTVEMILKWLKEMGYSRAHARIMRENTRSIRLFTGLGFKLVGESRPGEDMYVIDLVRWNPG